MIKKSPKPMSPRRKRPLSALAWKGRYIQASCTGAVAESGWFSQRIINGSSASRRTQPAVPTVAGGTMSLGSYELITGSGQPMPGGGTPPPGGPEGSPGEQDWEKPLMMQKDNKKTVKLHIAFILKRNNYCYIQKWWLI